MDTSEFSEEKREQKKEARELNVPVKYNSETGKYEADKEALNEKVEEMNKESSEPSEPSEESREQKEEQPQEKETEKQDKKPKPSKPNNKKGKEGSFKPMILIMLFSLVVAGLWEKVPAIKNAIHAGLDPTAGVLLNWNLHWGMFFIILIITVITTLVQKYGTDQETLKELKKEQKELQKEMKKHRSDPSKTMELQKKQMKLLPKQMKLSMRGIVYTGVPFILLIRWFHDYFEAAGNPQFFGFMGWIVFYLLGAVIIGSILRKWWNVV